MIGKLMRVVAPVLFLLAGNAGFLTHAATSDADAVTTGTTRDPEKYSDPDFPGKRISFNAGWLFSRYGQMPDGTGREEPAGLEVPGLDDSAWRSLDLPHDWGIEGPFRAELPNVTAKLPWAGIGWYRKHFTIDTADQGLRFYIDFDGAMSHAKVWLNGHYLGEWPYGYSSFRFDLTPYLRFGGENVIAVRLDNPPSSSRWYPGGGIYRNTWLVKAHPIHVAQWGIFVHTPEVSDERARVEVQAEVDNQSESDVNLTIRYEVWPENAPGQITVRSEQYGVSADAGASAVSQVRFDVPSPQLWSPDSPSLYILRTTLTEGDRVLDVAHMVFGIRSVVFDPQQGLLVNGRRVRIQGVNMHHDLGALGAAVHIRAMERQLELLQEMGVNAIRTAHNPPAPELLSLTDRMGFLVVNELFDAWKYPARAWVPNDYARHFAAWHARDVEAFVKRDRNHPSVILWSSGNEVREQREPGGVETALMLKRLFHHYDPTRPVTASLDHPYAVLSGFHEGIDVIGLAYKPHLYANTRSLVPDKAVFGTETASVMSSRGEYHFPAFEGPPVSFMNAFTPVADSGENMEDMQQRTAAALEDAAAGDVAGGKEPARQLGTFHPVMTKLHGAASRFQAGSYDLFHPPWGSTADTEFAGQDANAFVAGEFVWTGFDYLGEPNPYDSGRFRGYNHQDDVVRIEAAIEKNGGYIPSRSSYFGIFDLAGFRKDRFYLYQARWRSDLPMVHILPHWNWPERKGEVTPVHVYTSGDEGELFLNGKSQGRKKRGQGEYRLRWDEVRYEPGELKVITWRNGEKWAEAVRRTTGPATRLVLQADRSELQADAKDLAFVTVDVVDKNGEVVPRAMDRIQFTLSGPGRIIAVDNGDATRMESFQSEDIEAFNGKCLVVVRSSGTPGNVKLAARAQGMTPAEVVIRIVKP